MNNLQQQNANFIFISLHIFILATNIILFTCSCSESPRKYPAIYNGTSEFINVQKTLNYSGSDAFNMLKVSLDSNRYQEYLKNNKWREKVGINIGIPRDIIDGYYFFPLFTGKKEGPVGPYVGYFIDGNNGEIFEIRKVSMCLGVTSDEFSHLITLMRSPRDVKRKNKIPNKLLDSEFKCN